MLWIALWKRFDHCQNLHNVCASLCYAMVVSGSSIRRLLSSSRSILDLFLVEWIGVMHVRAIVNNVVGDSLSCL